MTAREKNGPNFWLARTAAWFRNLFQSRAPSPGEAAQEAPPPRLLPAEIPPLPAVVTAEDAVMPAAAVNVEDAVMPTAAVTAEDAVTPAEASPAGTSATEARVAPLVAQPDDALPFPGVEAPHSRGVEAAPAPDVEAPPDEGSRGAASVAAPDIRTVNDLRAMRWD